MKTQFARVVKIIDSEYAEIEVTAAAPESHDCCCGGQQPPSLLRMKAKNEAGAGEGDEVAIEEGSAAGVGFMALALAVTLVLLVFGTVLWSPWGALLALTGVPALMVINKLRPGSGSARIVSIIN
jgi:hypothetical protein